MTYLYINTNMVDFFFDFIIYIELVNNSQIIYDPWKTYNFCMEGGEIYKQF